MSIRNFTFQEYVEIRDQEIQEGFLDSIRKGAKNIDAGISGFGTGATQVGRGLMNTGLGALKGVASAGVLNPGGVMRGLGQTASGLGQIASSPISAMRRAAQVRNNPFSFRKPEGGPIDQWLGVARKRRTGDDAVEPENEPNPAATPQVNQNKPQSGSTYRSGRHPNPEKINRPSTQQTPANPPVPKPRANPHAMPDEIRLRFRPIKTLLDDITMKKKPGTAPSNAQKLLKQLLHYSTMGNHNIMPQKKFRELCISSGIDPDKLYKRIV